MHNYDIYGIDEFICTILEKNEIEALKKAEKHGATYEKIHHRLCQERSIEIVAIQQNNPGTWMSSVYSAKKTNVLGNNYDENSILRGLVYLRTENGLYRTCLALKKGNEIAYFDRNNFFITTLINTDFLADEEALQQYAKEFPNHFEIIYSDIIFQILKENLEQNKKLVLI